MELLAVKIPHIVILGTHLQVRYQVHKLLILGILLERRNWDAVCKLLAK